MIKPEKDILPSWFWKLLPILSERQSDADFEQWLYASEAENIFPSNIYAELLWVNYQNGDGFVQISNLLSDFLHLGDKMRHVYELIDAFSRSPELWHDNVYLWQFLPLSLSDDFLKEMAEFLYPVSYLDDFFEISQEQKNYLKQVDVFLGLLCWHLAKGKPLPKNFQAA